MMGFIWFWLVAVMIVGYVVLDGFDLGVGGRAAGGCLGAARVEPYGAQPGRLGAGDIVGPGVTDHHRIARRQGHAGVAGTQQGGAEEDLVGLPRADVPGADDAVHQTVQSNPVERREDVPFA